MLEQKVAELEIIAQQKAAELTTIRAAAAEQLSREVTANFPDLGMEHARLEIA